MQKDRIIEYYENSECDYRLFWDLNYSMALHAGYWDESTKSLRQALRRENEFLANKAKVKSADRILDAGCGVGGSAIFLAKEYECRVTGISISLKQVQKARSNAFALQVKPMPEFREMDYIRTDFKDGSFDLIWAVESICHAADKQSFAHEAYRLLAPEGRLIVADRFASKYCFETDEENLMRLWLSGHRISSLATKKSFLRDLEEAGFDEIDFLDITPHIRPSSKRLYWYSLLGYPFLKCGEWLALRTKQQNDNLLTARHQYQALQADLWLYGVFLAKKPTLRKI